MPKITQKQISDDYIAYLQGQNSNINASAPLSYWSIIAGAEGSVFLDLYANLDIVGKSIYIQNLQGSQIDNTLYESGLTPRGALTVSVIGVSFEEPISIPANTQFQTTNGIIYTLYQGVDYLPPPIPPATFTTSTNSGIVPFSVTFTNTTIGIPNVGFTWTWSVTGGTQGVDWSFTTGSSITQDVVIQFNNAAVGGTQYSVTLNASLAGVIYAPTTAIITASQATIQADFNFYPPNPITITTVTFTDATPNPLPTGYAWSISPATGWNYTGGTSATSKNPQIIFNILGTYNVTNSPTKSGTTYTPKVKAVPVTQSVGNPTVTLYSPTPTTNVPISTIIALQFSTNVSNVTTNTIQLLYPDGRLVPITVTLFNGVYYIDPQVALLYSTTYTVNVLAGITSAIQNLPLVATFFTFTTASSAPNPTDPQETPVTLYAIVGGSTTFLGYKTLLTTTLPIAGVPTTVTASVETSIAGQNQESDQSCINRLLLQKRSPTSGARSGDYYQYAREASTEVTDGIVISNYTTRDGINSLGVFPLIGSFISEYQLNLGLLSIVYPISPTSPVQPTSFTQYSRQILQPTLGIVNTYILSLGLLGLGITVGGCTTYSLQNSVSVTVSLPPIYTLATVLQIPSLDVNNSVITISITISDLIKREVRRVICNQPYGGTDLKAVNNNFITLNDIINGLNYQLSYDNGQIAKLLLDVQITGGNISVPKPQVNPTTNPDGIYEGIYDIIDYNTITIGN